MNLNTQPLDSIDWGTSISGRTISYSFATAGTRTTSSEANQVGSYTAESFNSYERAQFEAVFDLIETVTGLSFVQTNSYFSADIRLMLDTNEFLFGDLGAMVPAGEPGAGFGVFNGDFWDRGSGGDLDEGGFSFVTIQHEVLHGLGLAHPHDFGGSSSIMTGVSDAFDDTGNYSLNQGVYTTMTYNSGLIEFDGVGQRTGSQLDFGFEAGPMALDIAVLQEKYGVNTSHAGGNNTYDLADRNGSGTYWSAIWDTGGSDTIRYSGTRDVTVDLRAATLENAVGGGGYLSAADGIQGGFTIAHGVVIERALTGNGDDMIIGNTANNVVESGLGDDTIDGARGDDDIRGNSGNDQIKGGVGNDTLKGDSGDDTLTGGKGDDLFFGGAGVNRLVGQAGNDTLNGGNERDVLNGGGNQDDLLGNDGDDFLKGGTRTDALDGGADDDRLFGNRHNDTLNGGAGNDKLSGGGDNDRLNGGTGNDTLKGGDGNDFFIFERGGDNDIVEDFGLGSDRLQLDTDLLGTATTRSQIIDRFADVLGGNTVLDFGSGDRITLEDFTNLSLLEGQIDTF